MPLTIIRGNKDNPFLSWKYFQEYQFIFPIQMPNIFPEQRDDSEHLCHNNTKLMHSPTGIIPYPQKQWQINPLSVAVYENWYSHRTCCALLKYVTFSHKKTQNNIVHIFAPTHNILQYFPIIDFSPVWC